MSSMHETRRGHFWKRVALIGLLGQPLGCAPSDFDALTEETRDPVECVEPDCLDAGAPDLDAGSEDDADANAGEDELDSASDPDDAEPSDASTQDAANEAPSDAAAPAPDAARADAAAPADSGSSPRVCDGAAPACRVNEVERQMEACGNCGRGVRSRTRTCTAEGCSWGAWSAWSACASSATECDPNAPAQTQTVACTTCGTKTQTRSCSRETCTWGAWSDSSACSWCEDCAEVVYCDTPASIADRGTWCRQKACSRQQALSDCMEDVEAACGVTTQPFFMEYL